MWKAGIFNVHTFVALLWLVVNDEAIRRSTQTDSKDNDYRETKTRN